MEKIKYHLEERKYGNGQFNEITDYCLDVPCTNRADTLEYIYRLYKYEDHLFITDIFPRIFAGDSKCFQRFTSHEGYCVNMRKLAVTCLEIFVDEFISYDPDNIMVVSGSYEHGEPTDRPSRKLRLYWYFFSPLLDRLNLKTVDMTNRNAFLLLSKLSKLNEDEIKNSYIRFKQSQHNGQE